MACRIQALSDGVKKFTLKIAASFYKGFAQLKTKVAKQLMLFVRK